MPLKLSNWDQDLPREQDEEYQVFLRTLQFTEGFGILFVRCSPAGGEQLISKVKTDIHDQNIEVLNLDKNVTNLYKKVENLEYKNQINILFITGLESTLYEYEESKKLAGWSSRETHHYSGEDVPPILININQQREQFRDSFNICFVFLLPQFAIKYFIHLAPDFFDWRSGLFDLPLDSTTLEPEATRIIQEGTYEQYVSLTNEEINQEILELVDIIEHEIDDEQKAELFFRLGYLQRVIKNHEEAISSYDKALEFKPDYHYAWYNRGISLHDLGRDEEAISSYDKALELTTVNIDTLSKEYEQVLETYPLTQRELEILELIVNGNSNRQIAEKLYITVGTVLTHVRNILDKLCADDKKQAAILALRMKDNKTKAVILHLKFQLNQHEIWNKRGISLDNLGKYEEAISSYDKAVEIKSDFHQVWNNRGISLNNLGKYEEAISSYDKAVEIKPDLHLAWYNRGISLHKLGRYEEAIFSYDKAVEIKPNLHLVWYNLGRDKEAISSFGKAVEIKPDLHLAWNNRGISLNNLGKYEEAISSYDKAVEIKPDYHLAWYNKSRIYALQSNLKQAIKNLQTAINIHPEEVKEWAKTNSDFDAIREDESFQALIN
ncbi:tetratricopeptide repeat protein [Okeanomitos corallinicola TIOX110]|uniref:Tetratricopeptide repeat protein n=1 Tax=Okeanomitos corallinicola TIOX110 TaxID=3133117 RepID=A0ABZ2UVG8_9CYAN